MQNIIFYYWFKNTESAQLCSGLHEWASIHSLLVIFHFWAGDHSANITLWRRFNAKILKCTETRQKHSRAAERKNVGPKSMTFFSNDLCPGQLSWQRISLLLLLSSWSERYFYEKWGQLAALRLIFCPARRTNNLLLYHLTESYSIQGWFRTIVSAAFKGLLL